MNVSQVATKVMKHLIEEFASSDLFGRDNYEWYARVTGRVLRVQGEWICSFQYPTTGLFATTFSLEAEKTWLQCECARWHLTLAQSERPTDCVEPTPNITSTSLGMIPEHTLLESCTRLSISLEQNGLFKAGTNSNSSNSSSENENVSQHMTLEELRAVNRYAESTKSLSYLPLVHERQTARMRTRSEWFLQPTVECASCGGSLESDVSTALAGTLLRRSSSGTIGECKIIFFIFSFRYVIFGTILSF